MTIQELINQNESFVLDECSAEELLEAMDSSKTHLIANLVDLISRHWDNSQVQLATEKLIEDNPQLWEMLREKLEIPIRFRHGYRFKPMAWELSLTEAQSAQIGSLEGLVEEIPLNLVLSKNSLRRYEIEEEPSLCQKLYNQFKQSAAMNVAMASVVMGLFSSLYFQKQESSTASPSVIYHEVEVSPVKGFASTYNAVMQDLSRSRHPQVLEVSRALASIHNGDLSAVDNKYELNDSTDKKDELEDIILSFYENTNPEQLRKIQPQLSKVVSSVLKHSKHYGIDYRILLAILKTESDFENLAVPNASGDIGIGQINIENWSQEFSKNPKKFRPLDVERIKIDVDYAIDRTAEILALRKKGYGKDPVWYARYHNNNVDKKMAYAKKVNVSLREIKHQEKIQLEDKLAQVFEKLSSLPTDVAQSEQIDLEHLKKLTALVNLMKQQVELGTQKVKPTMIAMEKTSI